jgi:polar amino acid transport system substrate-binding protein
MHRASLAAALLVASCATAPSVPADVLSDLAPAGTIRAAINVGNAVLARRDAGTGEVSGVTVDISRELARRLGVPIELVTYEAAGRVVQDAGADRWDVAFVAIDPARATDIAFTPPYVVIEGAYLVPDGSPIRSNDDVDRDGVRVVAGNGSAYDLFLSRTLQHATIVRAPTSPAVVDTMLEQGVEVAAGVRQQMEADARRLPGLRVLDGRFMVIEQAMAMKRGRDAGAQYLRTFIEDLKASGFVAQALARHGIEGVSVAPPQGETR